MPGGFLPSLEKDYVQGTLFLPAIRETFERNGKRPLPLLCLPGRECRFLVRLLKEGFTTIDRTICIERDAMEALFIRGRLATFGDKGRAIVRIIDRSVYDYLTVSEFNAVAERFLVVDLDVYGTFSSEKSDLLQTIGAAISVQSRGNVPDWTLLVTTEIASVRDAGVQENLRAANARMIADEAVVQEALSKELLTDIHPGGDVARFMACAGAAIARAALPHFEPQLRRRPLVYR